MMIDMQSDSVRSAFAIEAVGVTGLTYPIRVCDGQQVQATAAKWTMSVALPADRRGTHMSRFVAALDALAASGEAVDLDGMWRFVLGLTPKLHAESATVEADFIWFDRVRAPISGLESWLESRVAFTARTGAAPEKIVRVAVAAKALCPCSKAISERGAHNQRSDLSATLHFAPTAPSPTIARVLAILAASASSPVYPLLKRQDEKFVTESAYDQPGFVEDIVRRASEQLRELPAIAAFTMEAVNRESIHAHDCFARVSWHRS